MKFTLFGLALAWLVALLFGAMEFDRGLLLLAYAGDDRQAAMAARILTEAGGAAILLPATAVGALILLRRRHFVQAALLIGFTLSGRLIVFLQKEWTERLRPDPSGHLVSAESLAFPSGHAANSAMVWIALALLLPRSENGRTLAIWSAVWLSLAVGFSRVMLGVHWPSDVIGGWAFGLFWSLLLLFWSERLGAAGNATPPGSFSGGKELHMSEDRDRVQSSREHDDSDIVEEAQGAPQAVGREGGNLQRDIGSRDELREAEGDTDGVTRVRDSDKDDGADRPRFNDS